MRLLNHPVQLAPLILAVFFGINACIACDGPASAAASNKARYDQFRIYRVFLETDEQVGIMQQLENRSDSYQFMGHARNPNQNLSIMVAPQKIAEITDLMDRFQIQGQVLVG